MRRAILNTAITASLLLGGFLLVGCSTQPAKLSPAARPLSTYATILMVKSKHGDSLKNAMAVLHVGLPSISTPHGQVMSARSMSSLSTMTAAPHESRHGQEIWRAGR